ncbi:MAG: ABC-F family ATP-binding cassette domain-containing protein [Clostridiales bacterium]|nr:ABC-F family ATP-binding cassette domain-containing protein [Candidatus Apopatocola equi]
MYLSAEHITMDFGSRRLLEDVSFYLEGGDKVGIIGVNGTGKSTFLRILAGQLEPDAGRVSRDPNISLSYLSQNFDMDGENTVLQQLFAHYPPEFRELNEYEARSMLNVLGISNCEQRVGTLSGGQRKRVALAAALIAPADVLLLDEPTNHLDAEMTLWLEERLRRFKGAIVMVTHDRYFLERVVNHITEVDRGRLYHYEANYSRYLELKTQRQEYALAAERKRQSILRVEREWILRGCEARRTKSRDRIERYEAMLNEKAPETDSSVRMTAIGSRLGRKLIELEHVSKSYGERCVIRDFSYTLLRDDRIGIIGSNGAGKSTLLKLMAGELSCDSGSVETGSTVKIGHFSQEGRELDLNQRVYDYIHEIASEVRTEEGVLSAGELMERFLFPRELQSQLIGKLSGGERRRLYLLGILMSAPNVLLLDEPTNDLDIMTLSVLEDYLDTFPGPVIAVSHDRFFLDKLSGQIFEVEGGTVSRFPGNWSDRQRLRRSTEAPVKEDKPKPAAERPQRQKKLKFTFAEQREFDTIDAVIAELEAKIDQCKKEQEAACSDYVRLTELTAQQEQLEQELEEKTERWVYLNELKERIDREQ